MHLVLATKAMLELWLDCYEHLLGDRASGGSAAEADGDGDRHNAPPQSTDDGDIAGDAPADPAPAQRMTVRPLERPSIAEPLADGQPEHGGGLGDHLGGSREALAANLRSNGNDVSVSAPQRADYANGWVGMRRRTGSTRSARDDDMSVTDDESLRGGGSVRIPGPAWVDDDAVDACQACDTAFWFFLRRHHCRQVLTFLGGFV